MRDGQARTSMTAARLEEVRSLLYQLEWEVANHEWDDDNEREIANQLRTNLRAAHWRTADLRDIARTREV